MAAPTAPPREWRAGRRLRAWALHTAGWPGSRIAAALGVPRGAVSQWVRRARVGGAREAVRTAPRPGRQPQLTEAQRVPIAALRTRVETALFQSMERTAQRVPIAALRTRGAASYGFSGELWTTERVAMVIKRTFGVSSHPAHMRRLRRQRGWPVQKPALRATQRAETAVARWWDQTWPARSAKLRRRGARSCS